MIVLSSFGSDNLTAYYFSILVETTIRVEVDWAPMINVARLVQRPIRYDNNNYFWLEFHMANDYSGVLE